jgi:hypothetical protein
MGFPLTAFTQFNTDAVAERKSALGKERTRPRGLRERLLLPTPDTPPNGWASVE